MVKKGDTLIEVTLAVGIFSMIAIAIVAVMSGGTVGAQTALETTLTREEIDTQAEALRFIHAAYIADKDSNNEDLTYIKLWKAITAKAIDLKNLNQDEIIKFTPSKDNGGCQKLYTDSNQPDLNKRFIINPRALGELSSGKDTDNMLSKVFIPYDSTVPASQNPFGYAQTYPHLIYGTNGEQPSNLAQDITTNLYRAEGIYIIAVKDSNTTKLSEGGEATKTSAFYDFYIRTCWYGANAEDPSTISTVMRLYDPDAIKTSTPSNSTPSASAPEYHINSKNTLIAKINGRSFTKANDGGAYVGYTCHTYPDDQSSYSGKSFIGPVLVSKNQNAVAYKADNATLNSFGSINYKNSIYYVGSWEKWMQVDSCANASNYISDAKGNSKVYTWQNRLTGGEAVKATAMQLLEDVNK